MSETIDLENVDDVTLSAMEQAVARLDKSENDKMLAEQYREWQTLEAQKAEQAEFEKRQRLASQACRIIAERTQVQIRQRDKAISELTMAAAKAKALVREVMATKKQLASACEGATYLSLSAKGLSQRDMAFRLAGETEEYLREVSPPDNAQPAKLQAILML